MLIRLRRNFLSVNLLVAAVFAIGQPLVPEAQAQFFKKSDGRQSSSPSLSGTRTATSFDGATGGAKGVFDPSLFQDSFERGDVQQWASQYESYASDPLFAGRAGSPTRTAAQDYPSSFPTDNHVENFNTMLKALESSPSGVVNRSTLFNSFDDQQLAGKVKAMDDAVQSMFAEVDRMYDEIDAKDAKAEQLVNDINAMETVGPKEAAAFNGATEALAEETRQMAAQIDPMMDDLDRMTADIDSMQGLLDNALQHRQDFDKDLAGIEEYLTRTRQSFAELKDKLKADGVEVTSELDDVEKFLKEADGLIAELRQYKKDFLAYIEEMKKALKQMKADLDGYKKALKEVQDYLNAMADYFAALKVQPDGDEPQGNPDDAVCAAEDEKYSTLETCRDNCKLKTCLFKTSVGGVKCYECLSGGHEQCADYSMLPADVSWCHPGGICYDMAEFVCSPPISIMTKELIPIECTTCQQRPDECGLKVHPRSTLFTKCNATCPGQCEYAGSYTKQEWDGRNEDLHCYKCPKPLPPSTCEDLKWGYTEQKDCVNACQQQHGPDAACALQNFQMKAADELKERERKARREKKDQKGGQPGKGGKDAGQGGGDKAGAGKGAQGGAKDGGKTGAGKTGEKSGGGVNGTPPPPTGGGTDTGGGQGPSAIAGGGQGPAGGKNLGPGTGKKGETRVDKKDPPPQPEKPKLPTDTGTTSAPDAPAGTTSKAPAVTTKDKEAEAPKDPCEGKDYTKMFRHEKDDTIEKMNFRSRFIAEYNKGPNNFLDFKEKMLNDSETPTQQRVWFNEFNQKIVDAASDPCSGFTYPRRLTKEQETALRNDPCKGKKRTSVADYKEGETKEQKAFRDRYVQALRSGKLTEFRNSVVDGKGNDAEIGWLSALDRQVDELVKDPCSDVKRSAPPASAGGTEDKTDTGDGTETKEKDPCADKRPFMRAPKDESAGKSRMRHNYLRYLRQGGDAFGKFTSSVYNGDDNQKVTWLNELNKEFKAFSEDPCFGGTPPKKVDQPQQPDTGGSATGSGGKTATGTPTPTAAAGQTQTGDGTATTTTDAGGGTTQTTNPCAGKRSFNIAPKGEDPRKTELRTKLFNAANNYKTLRERSDNLTKFRREFFKPDGSTPQTDIDFMHELFQEYQSMLNDPCFNSELATRERQRQLEEQARAQRPDPCKDQHVKDLTTAPEGEHPTKSKVRQGYVDALKQGPDAVEKYKQSLLDAGNPFQTNWFFDIRAEHYRLINTPCYKDGRDLGRPGFEETTEVKKEEKKPEPTQFEQLTEGLGDGVKTDTKTVADTTHVTTTYKDGKTLLTTTTGDGVKYHILKDKDGKVIGSVTEYADGSSEKIDVMWDGDSVKTERDGKGTTKITWSDNSTQETLVRPDGSRRIVSIDKYGYRFTSEYAADGTPISSKEDSLYKKEPGQRHYELYVYKEDGASWASLDDEMKKIYAYSERREQERQAEREEMKKLQQERETRRKEEEARTRRFSAVNNWLSDLVQESIKLEQAEADRLRTLAKLKVDVEAEYNSTIKRLVKQRDAAVARKDTETAEQLDEEIMSTMIWYEPFIKLTDTQKRLDEKQAARWAIGSQANSFARTVQAWAVGDLKRLHATEKDVTKVTQWLLTGSQVQQKTLRERFMSNSEEAYLSARVDWLQSKLKDPNLTSVEREVINEMLELNELGLSSARQHIRSMHVLIGVGYAIDIGMTVFGGKLIGMATRGVTKVVGKVASQATMKTLQTPVRTLANRALQRATTPSTQIFAKTTSNAVLKAAQRSFDPRYGVRNTTVRAAHWVATSRGGQLATALFKAVFTAPIKPSLLWKSQNVVFASSSKVGQAAIQQASREAAAAGRTFTAREAERVAQKAVEDLANAGRGLTSESKAIRTAEQARRSKIRAAAKAAEANLSRAAGAPTRAPGTPTAGTAASNVGGPSGGKPPAPGSRPPTPGSQPPFDPTKTQTFDSVLQPPPNKPVFNPADDIFGPGKNPFDPSKTQEFTNTLPLRRQLPDPQPTGDYSFDLRNPDDIAAFEEFHKKFTDYVVDLRTYTGTTKSPEPFDILRGSLEAQPWYRALPKKGQLPRAMDPNASTLIERVPGPTQSGTWVDGTRHFPDVLQPPHMPPPGWDKTATVIDQPIPGTGWDRAATVIDQPIPATGWDRAATVIDRPIPATGWDRAATVIDQPIPGTGFYEHPTWLDYGIPPTRGYPAIPPTGGYRGIPPTGWDKAATVIDQPIPSTGFFENPTVLNRNPFTQTGQFNQVLPVPGRIPPTVGPTRFDPTKTAQFDSVLTPPQVTQRFNKVLAPPQPRTPTQAPKPTPAITETQVVAPPPKPRFHNPFKPPAKSLHPDNMLKGAELTNAERAWEKLSIKAKIRLLRKTLEAIRDAALMGDRWATRILTEVAAGRLKFHFDPTIDAYGVAHIEDGIIRLNPYAPGETALRSGDNVASTLVHEYVHIFKGGKVWAAKNIPGKSNLPLKGNYNENRAHLAEAIFNRNLFNARVEKLREAGVPLTEANLRRVFDISKIEELHGAMGVSIDHEVLEMVIQSGGGIKTYLSLMRAGDDIAAIRAAAQKEGISLEKMMERIRIREGIRVKRTLQRNLVGEYFDYGSTYQDDIFAAIYNLSTARGGSITRAKYTILKEWLKVIDNPNPRTYAQFKKFLQDEFLTPGGAVRTDMRNWDLPAKRIKEFAAADDAQMQELIEWMNNITFSMRPSLRAKVAVSQIATEVVMAKALARQTPLSSNDVLAITHQVLQRTLAGAEQKLTIPQYQELVLEISSKALLDFGLQGDQVKEGVENTFGTQRR